MRKKYIVYDGDGETRESGKPWARFDKSHKGLESAIEHAQLVNSAVLCEGAYGASEIVWTPEGQPNSNDNVPVL